MLKILRLENDERRRVQRSYRSRFQNGASRKTARQRAGKSYTKFMGRHLHRVVAEKILGRPLRKGEIVHHIDGNHLNNAPDNLQVMTRSEHMR